MSSGPWSSGPRVLGSSGPRVLGSSGPRPRVLGPRVLGSSGPLFIATPLAQLLLVCVACALCITSGY